MLQAQRRRADAFAVAAKHLCGDTGLFGFLCYRETDQRADLRLINLAEDTGERPKERKEAMLTHALTCLGVIPQVGKEKQPQTAMIGGGRG